jgi:hypothetical protein
VLETAALADSASASCAFTVQVADGVQMGEVLSAIMQFAVSISENFALGDVVMSMTSGGVPVVTFNLGKVSFSFKLGGNKFNFKLN